MGFSSPPLRGWDPAPSFRSLSLPEGWTRTTLPAQKPHSLSLVEFCQLSSVSTMVWEPGHASVLPSQAQASD